MRHAPLPSQQLASEQAWVPDGLRSGHLKGPLHGHSCGAKHALMLLKREVHLLVADNSQAQRLSESVHSYYDVVVWSSIRNRSQSTYLQYVDTNGLCVCLSVCPARKTLHTVLDSQ